MDTIIPAACAVAMATAPVNPRCQRMKRISLYKLPKINEDQMEVMQETVNVFNEMDGIKATFHGGDEQFDRECPGNKSHTHALLVISSSRDSLKNFLSSEVYTGEWTKQLAKAGCKDKETLVHDSSFSLIQY